jgi:hypothetical protein
MFSMLQGLVPCKNIILMMLLANFRRQSILRTWNVATLALGSRPKQRACKGVNQEEAQESRQRHCKGAGQEDLEESHHILPGV